LTTQAHQNLICSPAGNILFFKALEQNKADFVKLFIQQNIDLMESERTTSRIFNLFKTRFVEAMKSDIFILYLDFEYGTLIQGEKQIVK